MSEKIKELVKRLRDAEVGEAFQTEDGSPELQRTELGLVAADALEAMAGEVERWRNNSDNKDMHIADLEAERDRLKEALLDIKHFGAGFAQDRARKALGGDAS